MRGRRAAAVVAVGVCTSMVLAPMSALAGNDDQTGKSTLDETVKKSGTGFVNLVKGKGEGYVVRTDMSKGKKGRAARRTSLTFFGQLTDPQLADEMSPARTELVDPAAGPISAAWRPQEALGSRVFDSIIRNMNANRVSRVKQGNGKYAKLQYAVLTGDIADSAQYNEVNWFREELDGDRLDPYSGKLSSATNTCKLGATPQQIARNDADVKARHYVGVQNFADWPGQIPERYAGFWDPNVGGTSDAYGYGSFPKYPNLMDAAQKPMTPQGLKMPWFITRGNHDTLVQGNVPSNLEILGFDIGTIATGCNKPWPNTLVDPNLLKGIPSEDVFAKLAKPPLSTGLLYGLLQMRLIPPDPDRRYVSKAEFKQLVGSDDREHGYDFVSKYQNKVSNGNATYYAFNRGPIRYIMLDSNAEGGGAAGNIDNPQFQWLKKELNRNSSVRIVNGKLKRDNDRNKLIVISSHHTIDTMTNTTPDEAAGTCTDNMDPGCDSDPRNSAPMHLGTTGKDPLLPLLTSYPNVIGYVNGHTHHDNIKAFKGPKAKVHGKTVRGGFWQVNTSSHVDWPQQSRTVELMDNKDGTLSIFGTVLESAAPIKTPKVGTDAMKLSNKQLAAISRRLSANDPQSRDVTDGGGLERRKDRNAELLISDPRTLWKVHRRPHPDPCQYARGDTGSATGSRPLC